MSKKYKNIELKKQFDDMVYEIVKTTTLNSSDEVNNLIEKMKGPIMSYCNIGIKQIRKHLSGKITVSSIM